jgi:hypothetical protein
VKFSATFAERAIHIARNNTRSRFVLAEKFKPSKLHGNTANVVLQTDPRRNGRGILPSLAVGALDENTTLSSKEQRSVEGPVIPFTPLRRTGWSLACPFCRDPILYTLINNPSPPVPFFYSERGNDVLLRKSDLARVEALYERSQNIIPSDAVLEALWKSLLDQAPLAPDGGHFVFWANVKCPSCKQELPYNNGIRDLHLRIFEPGIILVDHARIIGDSHKESCEVIVELEC